MILIPGDIDGNGMSGQGKDIKGSGERGPVLFSFLIQMYRLWDLSTYLFHGHDRGILYVNGIFHGDWWSG